MTFLFAEDSEHYLTVCCDSRWLTGAFGGLRRVKTVKKPRKMARNGLRRAKNGDYDRKWPQMAANGGREQSGKGILAGKQEMGTKTGGEGGLDPVFVLFPVFLLGCWFC